MNTIEERFGLLCTALTKARTEWDYLDFVKEWKNLNKYLTLFIKEHKMSDGNHHQSIAKKYSLLAFKMLVIRRMGKSMLRSNVFKKMWIKPD